MLARLDLCSIGVPPSENVEKPIMIVAYHELTGKPLGITGEVGEYLAAKILGPQLTDARAPD